MEVRADTETVINNSSSSRQSEEKRSLNSLRKRLKEFNRLAEEFQKLLEKADNVARHH